MSFLKRLFGRKNEPQPVPEVSKPTNVFLTFELTPDGNVIPDLLLPEMGPGTEKLPLQVATFLYLLNEGKLMPLMQEAITMGGIATGQEGASRSILGILNSLLAKSAQYDAVHSDKARLRPSKVFSRENHG